MKQFLIYILSLLVPLSLVVVVLEVIVTKIPNSYSYKYDYVKSHGDSIEVLAVGHSQLYDGFDAKAWGNNAFNLCNSSQEFIDSFYILKKLLDDMPNLKFVIMPLAYPEVSPAGSKIELSERSTYYHEYMHIDYGGQLPLKYRFEGVNIPKAFTKIYDYYVAHENIIGCDSLGRRNMYDSIERTWKLEENKIISKYYTLKQKTDFMLRGDHYLELIIEMLKSRNVHLVLVSPPYYYKSLKDLNHLQQAFVDDYIEKFVKKEGVLYLNYQECRDFTEQDFYDEAHLSEFGAKKFTRSLKKQILLYDDTL